MISNLDMNLVFDRDDAGRPLRTIRAVVETSGAARYEAVIHGSRKTAVWELVTYSDVSGSRGRLAVSDRPWKPGTMPKGDFVFEVTGRGVEHGDRKSVV